PRARDSSWEIEQSLADELTLPDAGGAGKQAAAGVGGELVESVQFRHAAVDLDEACARIALVGDEHEPGVVQHALTPGRPALGGEADPVIVRVGPPQDLRAIIDRRRAEPDMGVVGDQRVAVLVRAVKIERVLFAGLADRRPGIFVPANHLLLKVDLRSIPMLERNPDPPDHHIAAAAHPVRTLLANPYDVIEPTGSVEPAGR